LTDAETIVQAYAAFNAALVVDPDHLDSLLACGNLHRSCLLLAEAADMFRRAHAVDPGREVIRQALSAALTDLGVPPPTPPTHPPHTHTHTHPTPYAPLSRMLHVDRGKASHHIWRPGSYLGSRM